MYGFYSLPFKKKIRFQINLFSFWKISVPFSSYSWCIHKYTFFFMGCSDSYLRLGDLLIATCMPFQYIILYINLSGSCRTIHLELLGCFFVWDRTVFKISELLSQNQIQFNHFSWKLEYETILFINQWVLFFSKISLNSAGKLNSSVFRWSVLFSFLIVAI